MMESADAYGDSDDEADYLQMDLGMLLASRCRY